MVSTVTPTASIHWVGAGLSSGPGIVDLADSFGKIHVWDMTPERVDALRAHLSPGAEIDFLRLDLGDELSVARFQNRVQAGDVVVSMLPAALHVQLARLALEKGAHLVTSSYLSDDMRALNDLACQQGGCVINEVGLDPGLDHLFAHVLVDEARRAGVLGQGREIDFVSYCGGVPVEKSDFTYKFSWTPLGVLTALKNEARLIRDHEECRVAKAWQAVSELQVDGETFEVYPNRDSIPYIREYGLEKETNLKGFVRGTLRLEGWKAAWKDIFARVETAGPEELKELSDKLWRDYAYAAGEQDRVVLHVALRAMGKDGQDWNASLTLDEVGSGWKSAMASTVSLTVAQTVKAVLAGRMPPGVQAGLHDVAEARRWLDNLRERGLSVRAQNVTL
tara:strand:- start:1038 stop:2213 length:1176 start_codon:yes stop_codon:yes gene_type:complete